MARADSILCIAADLHPTVGGPATSIPHEVRGLARAGLRVTLVHTPSAHVAGETGDYLNDLLCSSGARVVPLSPIHIWVHRTHRWGLLPPSSMVRLAREVRRHRVVHVQGVYGFVYLLAMLLARLMHRRVVLTPREQMTDFDIAKAGALKGAAKRFVANLACRFSHLVVFTSLLEKQHSSALPLPQTAVVWNIVPSGDRELGPRPAPSTRVVGYLGRFDPKKNVGELVDAVLSLTGPWQLLLGGGTSRDLSTLGIDLRTSDQHRVRPLGFLPGSAREHFFDSIDCLVMPSAFECFGNVAAEAMVRGVPVLVSESSGVAEVIRAAEGGGLIVGTNSAELQQSLLELFVPETYTRHSARAYTSARSVLTEEHHTARLLSAMDMSTAQRARREVTK